MKVRHWYVLAVIATIAVIAIVTVRTTTYETTSGNTVVVNLVTGSGCVYHWYWEENQKPLACSKDALRDFPMVSRHPRRDYIALNAEQRMVQLDAQLACAWANWECREDTKIAARYGTTHPAVIESVRREIARREEALARNGTKDRM